MSHRGLLLVLAGIRRYGDRRSGMGGPPGRPGSGAAFVRGKSASATAFGEGVVPGCRGVAVAGGTPSAGSIGVDDGGIGGGIGGGASARSAGTPRPAPWHRGTGPQNRPCPPSPRQRSMRLVIVWRGGAAQRQGDRPEPQLEQAVAARGLGVVVALRRRDAQDLDLTRIETEALVDRARLRLQGAIIGQEDARRAALDQRGGDGRALDVGQRLGGEHHRDILLAQRLQPLADAGREQRIVQKGPGFVEDQQCRAAIEAGLQSLEERCAPDVSAVWIILH